MATQETWSHSSLLGLTNAQSIMHIKCFNFMRFSDLTLL